MARDQVFVSYSHANPAWRDRLLVLLKPFVRQARLEVWADPYIQVGSLWRREIDDRLERAAVAVILLTPELLASDFIADVELPAILRAATAGELRLIVVPIEACAEGSTRFPDGDLAAFQWSRDPAEPLAELPTDRRNSALVKIVNTIVDATSRLTREGRPTPLPTTIERDIPVVGQKMGSLHGVPPLPPHYVARNDAHDSLKQALLGASAVVGVSSSVGLHGQGGLGKTVVAQGALADKDVRRAYPDGIYWLSLGQQPHLELLQSSLAAWCGKPVQIRDVAAGTRLLRDRLQGKSCLLILDDVWQLAHAKAFDVLDGRARLLVTTRDRSILTALGANEMRLSVMPLDVASELLALWSGVPRAELPGEAAVIAKEVNYLPLALSLAGAQIRDGGTWPPLLAALRKGDIVYLDHPYGSVFKSIQSSLDTLTPLEASRYIELAALPEDVGVPISVVAQLWPEEQGDGPSQAQTLIRRLAARNLLQVDTATNGVGPRQRVEDDGPLVRLHDLQADFVRLMVRDLPSLHRRLVNRWRALLAGSESADPAPEWSTLPPRPAYHWHFLAHHLRSAGDLHALESLLTDPKWLVARMRTSALSGLINDYREVPHDSGLQSISNALVLSAHVLSVDISALSGQLAGRLLNASDPRVRTLIDNLRTDSHGHVRLTPAAACLTGPGGELLQTFDQHTARVTAIEVFGNGPRGLSGSHDGTLRLWDLSNGIVLHTFETHNGGVIATTALPDGRRVLSLAGDGAVALWDIDKRARLKKLRGQHGELTNIVATTDGEHFVSTDVDGVVRLWSLKTGRPINTFAARGEEVAIAICPDGARAVTGSRAGMLTIWDLFTGTALRGVEAHDDEILAIAVLPDGRKALSASADRTLKLWDLSDGTLSVTLKGHTDIVNTVSALPDGRRALSGSVDRTLRLWDLTTGSSLFSFEGHSAAVAVAAVLPDGGRALSGGADRTLKLWDVAMSHAPQPRVDRHSGKVTALTFASEGELGVSGDVDGIVKVWNLSTGSVIHTFSLHARRVTGLAILPNGQHAISSGFDGTLHLWDVATGEILRVFEGHDAQITGISVLADGSRAFTSGVDRTICEWDLATGTRQEPLEQEGRGITALSVSADGQCALCGTADGTLTMWDLARRELVSTFDGHRNKEITAVTVLEGSRRALSAAIDGSLKLWDLPGGSLIRTFPGHRDATVLAQLSQTTFVSAGGERTIKVWDPTSPDVLTTFYDDAAITCLSSFAKTGRIAVGNALGRVYMLEFSGGAAVSAAAGDVLAAV